MSHLVLYYRVFHIEEARRTGKVQGKIVGAVSINLEKGITDSWICIICVQCRYPFLRTISLTRRCLFRVHLLTFQGSNKTLPKIGQFDTISFACTVFKHLFPFRTFIVGL